MSMDGVRADQLNNNNNALRYVSVNWSPALEDRTWIPTSLPSFRDLPFLCRTLLLLVVLSVVVCLG